MMSQIDEDRATRLDGNAAAGLLAELFRSETSTAAVICAGCGASGPIGTLHVYGLEMGAILRCPKCEAAVMRIGATGPRRWLDLRGAVSVCVTVAG
jgi:hypothetical protein